MRHYLLQSKYSWLIGGLVLALAGLWYWWLKTDQIVTVTLLVYTSSTIVLNILLGYFSHNRHRYVTYFLLVFSYGLVALAAYVISSLTQGLKL